MNIQVFASLKEYFGPRVEVSSTITTIDQLKAELTRQNASAEGLLQLCRFAVDDTFVDGDYVLKATDTVAVIPPSSGG